MERTINLNSDFTTFLVGFQVYFMDRWDGNYFMVLFNGQNAFTDIHWNRKVSNQNLCGDELAD